MSKAVFIERKSGSMTVEASIIVPLVILSLAAVVFMTFVLYHRACLQSIADQAAAEAALTWDDDRQSLYWRLFDREKEGRLRLLSETMVSEASKHRLQGGESCSVEVEIRDYILYKKVVVTVKEIFRIPIGRFLKVFGAREYFEISVTSEAMVNDPVEFTRNTDFLIDTERELEQKYPQLKDLGEKTRGVMKDIRKKLESFFD